MPALATPPRRRGRPRKAPALQWQSRIVGDAMVSPATLSPHPHNWRVHTNGTQRDALQRVLSRVGWVQRVVVNQATNTILDGHERVALALERHETSIPVLYVDLTPDEERLVLATLDPIGDMAGRDTDMLHELLASIEQPDFLALAAGISGFDVAPVWQESDPLPVSPQVADANEITTLREDVLFDADNDLGIPVLRADRLATTWPTAVYEAPPCVTPHAGTLFLSGKPLPDDLSGGFLGFFIDDRDFEPVWRDAVKWVERMRRHPWTAVLAPDFSLWHTVPPVVQLYQIFRRQWCARYWQEAGFSVIPLVNAGGGLGQRSIDYALLGLPPSPPVVAMQVRTYAQTNEGRLECARMNGAVLEALRPGHCVIYGGIEHATWLKGALPQVCDYTLLPARTALMRRRIRASRARAGGNHVRLSHD